MTDTWHDTTLPGTACPSTTRESGKSGGQTKYNEYDIRFFPLYCSFFSPHTYIWGSNYIISCKCMCAYEDMSGGVWGSVLVQTGVGERNTIFNIVGLLWSSQNKAFHCLLQWFELSWYPACAFIIHRKKSTFVVTLIVLFPGCSMFFLLFTCMKSLPGSSCTNSPSCLPRMTQELGFLNVIPL